MLRKTKTKILSSFVHMKAGLGDHRCHGARKPLWMLVFHSVPQTRACVPPALKRNHSRGGRPSCKPPRGRHKLPRDMPLLGYPSRYVPESGGPLSLSHRYSHSNAQAAATPSVTGASGCPSDTDDTNNLDVGRGMSIVSYSIIPKTLKCSS